MAADIIVYLEKGLELFSVHGSRFTYIWGRTCDVVLDFEKALLTVLDQPC